MFPQAVLTAGLVLFQGEKPAAATPSATASASPSATPSASDLKMEQLLFDRVCLWWKARQARNHRAMYDLAPPSYRKEKSYEDFVVDSTMRSRFDLVSFRIEKADMSRQEAKVFVAARFDFVRFGTPETVAEDPWIKVDGTWYRKWEPVALPFPKS